MENTLLIASISFLVIALLLLVYAYIQYKKENIRHLYLEYTGKVSGEEIRKMREIYKTKDNGAKNIYGKPTTGNIYNDKNNQGYEDDSEYGSSLTSKLDRDFIGKSDTDILGEQKTSILGEVSKEMNANENYEQLEMTGVLNTSYLDSKAYNTEKLAVDFRVVDEILLIHTDEII